MAESPFFAIRNFVADNLTWHPIQAPYACNYWVVRGDADLLICSDNANPSTTQDTLAAGTQEGVMQKENPVSGARYPANTIFAYVQAKTGNVNVRTTFAL